MNFRQLSKLVGKDVAIEGPSGRGHVSEWRLAHLLEVGSYPRRVYGIHGVSNRSTKGGKIRYTDSDGVQHTCWLPSQSFMASWEEALPKIKETRDAISTRRKAWDTQIARTKKLRQELNERLTELGLEDRFVVGSYQTTVSIRLEDLLALIAPLEKGDFK